jgi:hypothetical protein
MGIADTQNFSTTPSEGQYGGGQQRPTGTGDNGQTWDPIQKRWVPQSSMVAGYDPSAGDTPVNAAGGAAVSNQGTDFGHPPQIGPNTTVGRVTNDPINGASTGQAWGGYAGTIVKNPDGSLRYDNTLSGQGADVNRLRGLGDAAANTQGPTINYGNANASALNANLDRTRQDDAISRARDQANGGFTPARQTAWDTLHQGERAQVAGAMSTRGGPLAQAAAMRTQQSGAAAYNQKGTNQIAALRADEMEQGRNTLANLTNEQRSGDIAAQYNNANQAINQGQMASAQRDLNQNTQLGYEGMSSNVNIAAANQQMAQREQAQKQQVQQRSFDQQHADEDLAVANDEAQFLKKEMSTGAGGGMGGMGGLSDRRAKNIVDYLGRK